MTNQSGPSLEDLVHEPGSGIPDRHLPERNPDALAATGQLQNTLRQLLRGHRVRVILTSDFSTVSVAVQSDCHGFAAAPDIEDLARAALAILAEGGYTVHFYPRGGLHDACLEVVATEGKAPRTDVALEVCVDALSPRR